MKATDFIKAALKTEAIDFTPVLERFQDEKTVRLVHAMVGMCTESGEFQDAVKKHIYYGKDLDKTNLVEELGDIMWYIAIATDVLGVTLEEVMQLNADKLASRYKGGFSEEKANNRNLNKEREILEKK